MRERGARERALVATTGATGVAALVGGLLLVVEPDGSLLKADRSALAGSPFTDWRAPGILLASLVGGGFLVTAIAQRRRWRHAHLLSVVTGLGLVCFEAAEVAWIGFQPLEVVFAGVGLAVVALAVSDLVSVRSAGQRPRTRRHGSARIDGEIGW